MDLAGASQTIGTAVLMATVLFSTRAGAQPASELTPSFDIIQIYDTNLLFSPTDRHRDMITRVTPGIAYKSQSPLFTFSGRYSFDAERFAEQRDLSAINGHHALIDFRYTPTRLFTFAIDTAFTETQMPTELNTFVGLAPRRADAKRLSVHPSARRQIGRNTTASADYSITADHFAGGIDSQAQRAGFQMEHHLSERDTATVGYEIQHFDFQIQRFQLADGTNISTAHVLTVGLVRDINRLASITLRGGPRVGDRGIAPEIAAALHTRLKTAELSLEYTETQAALIGVAGVADTQTIATAAEWTPWRSLQMRTMSGVFRVARAGLQAYGCRLGFATSSSITKTFAFKTSYEVNLQQGNIYSATQPVPLGLISRHVMSVGFAKTTGIGVH